MWPEAKQGKCERRQARDMLRREAPGERREAEIVRAREGEQSAPTLTLPRFTREGIFGLPRGPRQKSSRVRQYFLFDAAFGIAQCDLQLVACLQVHPELRRGFEITRKPQRRT